MTDEQKQAGWLEAQRLAWRSVAEAGAEAKAEAAERIAGQASEEADKAGDFADGITAEQPNGATAGKQAHLQAAQAHDRAAHANSMASIAHDFHADTTDESQTDSDKLYTATPRQTAEVCKSEMERHMAEAIYHRKQAGIGMQAVGFLVSRVDSTSMVWKHKSRDPMKSERFWWDPWTWDIAKAKRILEKVPHPIVEHDITDTIALLSVVDVADSRIQIADLSFPVIVGWMDDKMLVIDGWSRIAMAAFQSITHLPALILTKEENADIIDRTEKFDDDWNNEEDSI